ncbi:hypothetical protein ACIQU5_02625 [Streptomyces sp. NPDC090306]|uniref:hypothetical protein n=1 Tax=Streptomyces sp. NPDC090306 TaxID=3365961 RepID=UPI0038105017
MAWDEWEQLKARHTPGGATGTQLDSAPDGGGTYGPYVVPATTGDLRVKNDDLTRIGHKAHTLYDGLWDKARTALPGTDSAAADLSTQGFTLGATLRQVSTRWEEQTASLMDACAHISNHLQVTKKVHAGDETYIERQMSSIDTLDDSFDSRSPDVDNGGGKSSHP